jgi:hypothetical protein
MAPFLLFFPCFRFIARSSTTGMMILVPRQANTLALPRIVQMRRTLVVVGNVQSGEPKIAANLGRL